MMFTVKVEMTITKKYGKVLKLDAESEAHAREIAAEHAMQSRQEEAETDWEIWEDDDSTWDITEVALGE